MVFVACGLNHKTAPLDVREKVALTTAKQHTLLHSLLDLPAINEAAILSTCNRTEIYCITQEPDNIIPWLAKSHQLTPETIQPYFYLHPEHQGIRHTLRVASGLDSMMLGEPQILGQMKQAYQNACEIGTIKDKLRQLFPFIFSASKRIRNQSGIGNNPISVASAAVQLIGDQLSHHESLNVFLIGSGETASLVAKYLHKQGARHFMVASRTREHANILASCFEGEALTISDIPQYLPRADIVISATTCPLPFITKTLVEHAMQQRNHAPMFFLDLAVPRDIENNVSELANVHLYNIDDLQTMTDKGMHERRNAAQQAEQLVDYELENYIRWHRSLQAKDIICHYRDQMQTVAQQELKRAMQKLETGHCQHTVLSEFSERLVNKLTHAPSVGLRQVAWDGRVELLDLAKYLFNLSTNQSSHEKIS